MEAVELPLVKPEAISYVLSVFKVYTVTCTCLAGLSFVVIVMNKLFDLRRTVTLV